MRDALATESRLSISNSSHAPRDGITLQPKMSLSECLVHLAVEVDAGRADEARHTTTRSVPLMMNVPRGDISGKSPMKTVWLLISPVLLLMNSAVTNMGAE